MSFVGIVVDLDILLAGVVEASSADGQVSQLRWVGIWAEDGGEAGLVTWSIVCSYGDHGQRNYLKLLIIIPVIII